MSLGIKSFDAQGVHDGFLDSRWVPGFAIGSWIHGGFSEKLLVPTPSVAKDLMPRDIMSSEPRHWMVFGQLVMPVQHCKDKSRKAKEASVGDQWAPNGGTLDAR